MPATRKKTGKTVVVALGGNAILQPGQVGTFEEQLFNVDGAMRRIAELVEGGWRVVLTHGNGPQVGNLLIQNALAAKTVAPMPMDVCGAMSQGQIGYMLEQTLQNHLRLRRLEAPQAQVVLQGLLEHVADLTLAHRAANVHGHRRHGLGGERVLDEEVADLGAVTVGEHDAPAALDELGDAAHGAVDVEELLLEGAHLPGLQDGVAAEGDDDGLSGLLAGLCHQFPHASAGAGPSQASALRLAWQ